MKVRLHRFFIGLLLLSLWIGIGGCAPHKKNIPVSSERVVTSTKVDRRADNVSPVPPMSIGQVTDGTPLPYVPWKDTEAEVWASVNKLEREQKFRAAMEATSALIPTFSKASDGQQLVQAYVRMMRYRSSLNAVETALRYFTEVEWPKDLLSQTALNLHLAASFQQYLGRYLWEINQREKVVTTESIDLKKWTKAEIHQATNNLFYFVWQQRAGLGVLERTVLKQQLSPGDFPTEIRGTLRDTTTYKWASYILSTNSWTPSQASSTHRLDLASLLSNQPPAVDVRDLSIHPLHRYAYILAEHEAWHQKHNRRSAALEAFLVRVEGLHDTMTTKADRTLIRKALRSRLASESQLSWWAMGMAELADFVQASNDPDALTKAYATAKMCAERYPETRGGQRCKALANNLTIPEWGLEAMKTDNVNRRSIRLRYKNMKKVFFSAWKVDGTDLVLKPSGDAQRRSRDPVANYVKTKLSTQKPDYQWSVDLAETKDLKSHYHFVTPPFAQRGDYIVLSHRQEDRSTGRTIGVFLNLSNLVLSTKTQRDAQIGTYSGTARMYYVNFGDSGQPVHNARLRFYTYERSPRVAPRLVGTKFTDKNGYAAVIPGEFETRKYLFAIADYKGEDATVSERFYLTSASHRSTRDRLGTYVFTDRSTYRPGQTIHWQVLAFNDQSSTMQFKTAPNVELKVTLRDGNSQIVQELTGTTNRFGTFSGAFTAAENRPLGRWFVSVETTDRIRPMGHIAGGQIHVEAYKRPTFEAKFLPSPTPARLNTPTKVKGEARYYFGLPVTAGKAVWRVRRLPQYPRWWGWYNFPTQSPETIATGTADLDDEGKFELEFTPAADERLNKGKGRSVSYRYEISADVTDEGGETRVTSTHLHLGFVAVRTSMNTEKAFEQAHQSITLSAKRTNLNGDSAPGVGRWTLYQLIQPKQTLLPSQLPLPPALVKNLHTLPGDRQRPRFNPAYAGHLDAMRDWKDGPKINSGSLTHDREGHAKLKLSGLPAGAYRIRYQTTDPFGAVFETARLLTVVDGKTPLAVPLAFVAEQTSVKVGQTARLFVHSGFSDQPLFLTGLRQGKPEWRRQVNGSALIEIPIQESDRGGLAFNLQFLRDHQSVILPIRIAVPWDNKALDIRFSTFRDKLKPGQKETWSVNVKTSQGMPAVGEVLSYMYDRSLDIFHPHYAPNPMEKYRALDRYLQPVSVSLTRGQAFYSGSRPNLYLRIPNDDTPGDLLWSSGYGSGGLDYGGKGRGRTGPIRRQVGGRSELIIGGKSRKSRRVDADYIDAEAVAFEAEVSASPTMVNQRAGVERVGKQVRDQTPAQNNLRTNFSETAYFTPQLTLDENGSANIAFTVPDSVTSWQVYVHAITQDLSYGVLRKEVRTIKDLMVRPYLPRFLREGDDAVLQIVVNNASHQSLEGSVDIDIIDPDTKVSRLSDFGLTKTQTSALSFSAEKSKSAKIRVPLKAPKDLGLVAVKVTASTGQFSDGEQRAVPLLPSRMHLAQSRFTVLRDVSKKKLHFADLAANDDETIDHQSLVVTLDGQLFYSVLSALPYLVNYPYECTEQTLNRFLSTGILSSMYADYPAISRMASMMSERNSRWESFDAQDPNRKITLEETPWLKESRGGGSEDLLNVLDPNIAAAQRQSALTKLRKSQLPSGGFPWFPGGPASTHMTAYLVHGFAKALEFGVDVPKDMVVDAWRYLKTDVERQVLNCMARGGCWAQSTYYNYLISMYPDPSWYGRVFDQEMRKKMLAHSFTNWTKHSPYLKGFLALTLKRMDRSQDASLVWESVLDSAKTSEEKGTYWAPEDRAWLWYNDRIESHAAAIRTTMEISPKDPKLDGMVLWLFLNKKLNHWKSTRATAESIYALAHYLKTTGQLGTTEQTDVLVGDVIKKYVFEPNVYNGKKNQIVIDGKEINPQKHATITFDKKNKGYQLASATWHFSTEKLPVEARSDFLDVTRTYYRREKRGQEVTLHPLAQGSPVSVGDEVEIHLSISSKHALEYVQLRDPRGAGFEPSSSRSGHKWDLGIQWYEEVRDSGTNFFFERLPAGEYTFKYRIRAATEGTFKTGPAFLQPMYAPEFVAYSAGHALKIKPQR